MRIVLNGKDIEVTEGSSVLGLLEEKGIPADSVVVELNRDIIPADTFGDTGLNDVDHLEVLRFVCGG